MEEDAADPRHPAGSTRTVVAADRPARLAAGEVIGADRGERLPQTRKYPLGEKIACTTTLQNLVARALRHDRCLGCHADAVGRCPATLGR